MVKDFYEAQVIVKSLPVRDRIDVLDEECAELIQAVRKYVRAAGMSNNPTPVKLEDAFRGVQEEVNDVLTAMCALGLTPDLFMFGDSKMIRWANRILEARRKEVDDAFAKR